MESSQRVTQHHQEESVREVGQIHHTNATLQETPSNTYRAQTEASDIRIVTPNYKTGEKPGSDLKIGTTAAELNAKFSETNGDYKAERSQEHFRMQIIDPKVNSHAHLPAHAPREFARRKLMEDFPSLHGKRSFLNLDSLEQRRLRKDDSNLRELEALRQKIHDLENALPKEPPKTIVRREEVRREVVAKPQVKQTVQKLEESRRTEEVERRIIRRERRHKSHRVRHGHGYSSEYDWHAGGGGQQRSTSASRYNNGFVHPITNYETHHHSSSRRGDSAAASDRFFQQRNNDLAHARYGSLSDSLRRGELKYIPNGEVRDTNGYHVKHHRVHKSHSTRDVFGSGGGGHYDSGGHYYRDQPLVEFPPTLPRSDISGAPAPPPHRANGDYYRPIAKSRSYADWDQGRGHSISRYDDDMARLENEFRDSHLMRIPNGNMNEKIYRREEIPGGYESYEREVKSNSSGRRLHRDGAASGDIPQAS